MNTSTLSVIIMIVSCIIGVIYHEYGHLKAAKKHGITVETFCIGLGKPVIKHKGKDGVIYGVSWLPLGGYCSIDDDKLNNSSTRAYISVLMAGVLRNLIIGALLIIIGQMFIIGGFANPVMLFRNAVDCMSQLLTAFADILMDMFNIKKMASYGGFVGNMVSTGENLVAMSPDISYTIGSSLIMGGLMNYALAIFNALPIPGLDGGQVVIRLFCDFCKKVFNKEIKQNIVAAVNFFVVVVLCVYQAFLLLLDIPVIREFIINM